MKTPILSQAEQTQLFRDFSEALALLRNPKEASAFIVDILTKTETHNLIKRLAIARLLLEGKTYKTIESSLHVSTVTIARVAVWLDESGEGFRMIVERTKTQKKKDTSQQEREPTEWSKLKRRYPGMFWPQRFIEELAQNADNKGKEHIGKAIDALNLKSELHEQLHRALKRSHRKKSKGNPTL